MKITCNYCQATLPLSYLPHSSRLFDIYWCDKCKAEYVFWKSGRPGSQHLYTTINGKLYRWTFSVDNKIGYLRHYKEPGIPNIQPNRGGEMLQTFHDVPNITPDNIEEKIRMMLTFL